jgi:glutathione S-transferase
MTTPILHHYPMSPFSEKVRLILGFKAIDWQSVTIPIVMPKPDVVALTGGYRKTPILQVGADIYCDTALIAQVLEQIAPEPTLFPGDAPLAKALAQWADTALFWTMIPYVMQPAGRAALFAGAVPEALKAFAADRAAFTSGMKRQPVADATVNLRAQLQGLDSQLERSGEFLLGAKPSIADFSLAHNIWFIERAGLAEMMLGAFRSIDPWSERMKAFGHGRRSDTDSGQAIAIAAAAHEHAPASVRPGLGFAAGDRVSVSAIDYGSDPAAGVVVGLGNDEVVIERRDARAGTVHVHFPRSGFQIIKDAIV